MTNIIEFPNQEQEQETETQVTRIVIQLPDPPEPQKGGVVTFFVCAVLCFMIVFSFFAAVTL